MKSKKPLREIVPERLYPLQTFGEASGVTPTRRAEARRQGIELATVNVGRRKFVRGIDGIAYIEKLAELANASV